MSFVVSALLNFLLKFRRHEEFLRRIVVFDVKNIRLAADLAILYVHLSTTRGFVDNSRIPFSAGGALKSRFHITEHTL